MESEFISGFMLGVSQKAVPIGTRGIHGNYQEIIGAPVKLT